MEVTQSIQDLKPGEWVIRITHGRFYNPVEVAKITPTQIHTYWGSRNGVDKYRRIDGHPIGMARGLLRRPATQAEVESHKAEQQYERDKATARQQEQEAEEAERTALSALFPDGIYLQRGSVNNWDIVITDRHADEVRRIVKVLKGTL